MRIISEIPHPLFKITIFSWNLKYIIKIELEQYEQVYKIKEESVTGAEDVKKMLDEEFLESVMHRFKDMSRSFSLSWKKL